MHPTFAFALLCLVFLPAGLALGGGDAATPAKAEDFIVTNRRAFLEGLDLSKAQLAPVKAALDRGDVEAAGAAFIAYFRTKDISSPLLSHWGRVKRSPSAKAAAADRYLAGHMEDGYSVYEVPAGGLDWYECPLSCVTRFPIFGTLRAAISQTGDPKYVRFVADHILGYMRAYPIEGFAGTMPKQGWRDHAHVAKPWYWCMIPERLQQLSQTLALIRQFPEVSDEELLQIVQRMYQETGYLRVEMKPWVDLRHNGGCSMIEAMAECCAIFEDFRKAREWMDYDAQLAAQYIDQAFYPDGMCVELTVAYSSGCSAVGQRLACALREQEAMRAARGKVQAMITCMVALSDPTGWLPSFGDLYAGKVGSGICQPAVEWLDLPWAETIIHGGAGPLPPFTVWPQPGQAQWCGYYTMRSDWTPQARYMAIDGGPWGTTHQHGDKLSFVVTAGGAKFIIDPSGTRYASNRPESFISRQASGFLHNTITVDGVDEFRAREGPDESKEPLHNTWEHGEDYTLFASSYSFAPVKPVKWERRVFFAEKAWWLMQDALTGGQEGAQVEQNFQFEADVKIEFQGNVTVATAPNGAQLALVPLSEALKPQLSVGDKTPHTSYWPDGKPKQVLCNEDNRPQAHGRGWTGRGTDQLMPAPAVTYTGQVKLPAMITVALVPLAPGQGLGGCPKVISQAVNGKTVWTLPVKRGKLLWVTSPDGCSVSR